MNWKKEAENELRDFKRIEESLHSLPERIAAVSDAITAVKCTSSSEPVQGGGNMYEDSLLNKLTALYKANVRRVRVMRRGLEALNDTEAKVIGRFYIDNMQYVKAVDCLREEIGYEEAQINRIRNKALYHYTIAEFGLPEF